MQQPDGCAERSYQGRKEQGKVTALWQPRSRKFGRARLEAETGRQARGKPEQREERSQGTGKDQLARAVGQKAGVIGESQEGWRAGECCCHPKLGQSLNCLGGERGREPPRSKMKSKDGRKHQRAREWRRERLNWLQHRDRSRPEGAWSSATVGSRGKESSGGLAAVLTVEASAQAARDEVEWPLLRGRSLERGGNESSRAPRGMRARGIERELELELELELASQHCPKKAGKRPAGHTAGRNPYTRARSCSAISA